MKNKKIVSFVIFIACSFFITRLGFAHNGEDHSKHDKGEETSPSVDETEILKKINEGYLIKVKPIFERSCMNCHGSNTDYPWYRGIPGAKQLIDYDVREAKVHIDMTNDFPFGGHGSPSDDLKAIQTSLEKNTMPPVRYRIMNWSSKLNAEDLEVVRSWIQSSFEELKILKKD